LLLLGLALISTAHSLITDGINEFLYDLSTRVAYFLLGIAIVFGGAWLWRLRNSMRDAGLAELPGTTVLSTARTRELFTAILALQSGGVIDHLVKVPLGLSLVVSREGIEVWGGSPRHPKEVFALPWGAVSSIEPTMIEELGRRSRGIALTVSDLEGEVRVPFVIVGGGLGGLFPLSSARLAQFAVEFDELRPNKPPK
jgi:hypothetical protein